MVNKEEKTAELSDNHEPEAVNYRGIKAMPFIIGNETFEKIGTMGTLSNLVVYLTSVFNMKSITAATFINIFQGISNMAPLLGAFLSDTYFGRYKTLAFACSASFLGMAVLTLTAAIPKLHPPKCSTLSDISTCVGSTAWELAFLLSAFGFLVIGAGGIRPSNLAFGADQFDPATKSGQKGIRSFFNWYYFTFTFAVMVSASLIVYIQSNLSWAIGLGIPAVLMFFSCILFFMGSRIYVKVKPEGSPLTSVARVLVAATKKRKLKLPDEPNLSLFNYMPDNSINSKLPHTEQFRFLDKSAIITTEDQINPDGSAVNPWKLCSIQQVEEVKCLVRVMPIWASSIIFLTALVQQDIYGVFQALQSDRRLGNGSFKVPAASYSIFAMLSLTISIPIYDRVMVPYLQKHTGKKGGITLLQRMGIGFLFSLIMMLVCGLVEEHRRNLALTRPTLGIAPKGGATSSMSALWLIPQLFLSGLCQCFGCIGQIEFNYKQFPENMRSIAGSFFFLGLAMSSYLSGFLVSFVHHITARTKAGDWLPEDLNKGKLDFFYFLIAALGFINFVYFLICAKWYRYKADDETIVFNVDSAKNQTEKLIV
ncbi:hypothetical protein DITRI_Ditri16bG0118800 [Diplodiscus trichospermus]